MNLAIGQTVVWDMAAPWGGTTPHRAVYLGVRGKGSARIQLPNGKQKIVRLNSLRESHPTPQQLEEYVSRELGQEDLVAVSDHIMLCQKCSDHILARIPGTAENLIRAIVGSTATLDKWPS